jgi:hypothetical protein
MVCRSHAAECLAHPCSSLFFEDSWRRSLWGPLVRALRLPVRLHRIVWISPGLWFCGRSVIESKSSRFRCLSPRRLVASNLGWYKAIPDRGSVVVRRSSRSFFGASLPVTWSHPTLVRYKAFIRWFSASYLDPLLLYIYYLVRDLLSWRSGHPLC